MVRQIKVLAITNLFPNNKEYAKGIFNKQQFLELAKLCELKVVAPVQWLKCAGVNRVEDYNGIEVMHLCFFAIPRVGRSFNGIFLYLSLIGFVKKLKQRFDFDIILAFWVYPDGVGSYFLAKDLNVPLIIKAGGSDINYNLQYPLRRKFILDALNNADKIISVSNALKTRMVEIGIPENKIIVNPNGVNSSLFHSASKEECRKKLGIDADCKIILFVGNLVPVKGLTYLIEAFAKLSQERTDVKLLILGEGNLKASLEEQAFKLGVKEKIKFLGKRSHQEIPDYINSCDVFCLPSLNEGCPNVLLEAMSCGKPVVASRVGGIPDMVTSDKYGILVEPQNVEALAKGLRMALEKKWDNDFLQNGYAPITWESSSRILFSEIEAAVKAHG